MNQETRGKEEMSRKNLLKSESAAAIAIAAVLLLGLAFTIISVVKLNYAPEWKTNAERDYSYDAWSNMEDVKTRADIFTRFMSSDINYPYGLSATVPFSMGGGDVPVFEPSKSNSKLAVNTEECTMSITFGNHTLDPVHCGGVTYYSENKQYPDQVFRYENGALILAQGENSQMKHDPLFNITEDMGNYTVTFNAINLTGGPESVSSSTLTALSLTGCLIDPVLNTDVYMKANETINTFNLSISTHYVDAWATYFNNTAKDAGLEYDTDYKITYPDSSCVCLSVLPTGNKTYNIYVNQTVLCAELGRRGGALPGGALPSGSGNVMELGTWYTFELSDNETEILPLKDYKPGFVFPTEVGNVYLKDYDDKSYEPNEVKYPMETPFEDTFRFSSFTRFSTKPKSATIRMIYKLDYTSPSVTMNVAGNKPEHGVLIGDNNGKEYYLYNETTSINITDPSDLTYYLNINPHNGKNFHIDYLAVRLD
ncbi:hypothetical protein [Methanosarcina sp. 1.H.A.2.2]|uniref:hypothetical protein n=1 Tax=Methanosarcina sp. 1.H.A.2.2 TaxID=1483601 RepID=UPI000621BE67|nr:hypothetical protein [Methanosarcina sp. 1.H.A.2.2]KKH46400.1 hypothetical protein EO93_03350 [Methanosarcina sp. 1.H.A.2.2]